MKGAPETVIPLCSKTLDFKNNARYIKHQMVLDTDVMNMAKDGLKVLTFAYKDIKMRDLEEVLQKEGGEENEEFRAFIEKDMVYLLTIGFEDPLCEEATQTLQEIDENIKVRILSGDHIETAKSLAKRIGLINNSEEKNDDDLAVMDSKRFREEIGEYTMVWDSQAL